MASTVLFVAGTRHRAVAGYRADIGWLTTAAVVSALAVTVWLLVAAVTPGWRAAVAGRRPFSELLPAEAWAAMFALPIAASATSLFSSLGLTAWTLTVGAEPALNPAWRPMAAAALVLSVLFAVAVPAGAAWRTVMQKAQRNAPLFDASAPQAALERTLAEPLAAAEGAAVPLAGGTPPASPR